MEHGTFSGIDEPIIAAAYRDPSLGRP